MNLSKARLPDSLLFPLAAAINFFSITALLILAGLTGNGELAANIGIVQGAILVVFLSLSGNARNLILASSTEEIEKKLFYFRLTVLLPAVMTIFFLCAGIVETPVWLIGGLIIRRCSEWVAELQLANREKNSDYTFASRYIWINLIAFSPLFLSLIFSEGIVFYFILYAWSIAPAVLVWPFVRWILGLGRSSVNFSGIVQHIGSSVIIGTSTYIFRILIVLLAGKSLGGLMFTAYALGGVVSALYTYALGPSSMVKKKEMNRSKTLIVFVIVCMLIGLAIILAPSIMRDSLEYNSLFIYGVGFSLIGGGIMLLAQKQRLVILQILKKDVFVPDALANILLISTIPFAYYLFGQFSFTVFFLLSAVLNLFFYAFLAQKGRSQHV